MRARLLFALCIAALVSLPGHAQATADSCDSDSNASAHAVATFPPLPVEGERSRSPAMPDAIRSIIYSNWAALEPDGPPQMNKALALLKSEPAFVEFAHGRDVFGEHLLGTFSILAAWGLPKEIARCGLFHTAFSGDLFIFHFYKSESAADRSKLRDVIGTEAERLVHLFGTMDRSVVNRSLFELPNATLALEPRTIRARHGPLDITPEDQAAIMVVTIADYLDQMVAVNGWRDVYQHESPARLYPGDGKPEVALYWFSRVCRGIAPFLRIIPPIFDGCTAEITREDETAARDLYWSVVTGEASMGAVDQERLLLEAVSLNPWVAEPHVQLAQLFFNAGRYPEAAEEAREALRLLYTWASCWDKRIPFRQWVGFARMMLLRATRRAADLSSMPFSSEHENFHCGPLVSLKEVVSEMA